MGNYVKLVRFLSLERFFLLGGLMFAQISIHAQTKGFLYHEAVRKANSFTLFDKDSDSLFYFYEEALNTGIFFAEDHRRFIERSLLLNKLDLAKEYALLGAQKGMTWQDLNLSVSFAQASFNYYCERGDTLRQYVELHLKDVLSKSAFKANYMPMRPSSSLQKIFKKCDRMDQKGGRRSKGPRSEQKWIERDEWVYQTIFNLLTNLGRVPAIAEVGEEAHDVLSVCIMHMSAAQILSILPYMVTAINEGNYYYNEDLAYSIERSALYNGEYLIPHEDGFQLYVDTTHRIREGLYHSYLGEIYYPLQEKTDNHRFGMAPQNPTISVETVNEMRKILCLDPHKEHLLRSKIKMQSPTAYLQTIKSWGWK